MTAPTMLSLFSGVGGFDLGFQRAGWQVVGQVDIDAFCRRVLGRRFPGTPQHDDVRTVTEWWGDRPAPDVIAGGFPCWNLSQVNASRYKTGLEGGDGTGSELFWAALGVCNALRPRFVVLENVLGLLSSNDGRDFDAVLESLAACGYPYAEWRVLDSQFFGVAQRRRRVFVVACAEPPRGGEVLHELQGRERHPAPIPGRAAAGGSAPRAASHEARSVAVGAAPAPTHADGVGAAARLPRRVDVGPWVKRGAKSSARTGVETWGSGIVSRTLNTIDYGDVRAPVLCLSKSSPCRCCPDDPSDLDAARYAAMGNAVSVPVATWLARRLAARLI